MLEKASIHIVQSTFRHNMINSIRLSTLHNNIDSFAPYWKKYIYIILNVSEYFVNLLNWQSVLTRIKHILLYTEYYAVVVQVDKRYQILLNGFEF